MRWKDYVPPRSNRQGVSNKYIYIIYVDKPFPFVTQSGMDYKTLLKQFERRRAKVIALLAKKTPKEVAKIMGISKQRVGQIAKMERGANGRNR